MDSEAWHGPVTDQPDSRAIANSREDFRGHVWSVRTDSVVFDADVIVERNIVVHPGAVAVIALDDDDRVLLIRQYRHPVAMALFEPPAGLLDHAGEDPAATAARELAEEAGYEARQWWVLVDLFNSPGGSSEAIRVYLARDLHELPEGRVHTGEAEESYLPRAWVDLDDARDLVLRGQIGSPTAVAGVLAAWTARALDWAPLRPVDSLWTARTHLAQSGRLPGPPLE